MPIRPVRPRLAAVVLLLTATAACGTGTPAEQVQSAPSPSTASPTASPSASASPSAVPSPSPASPSPEAANTIEVTYAGGAVTGDTGRIKVKRGDTVTIKVTSDVADEVHAHGVDLSEPVAPGKPATLTFTAQIPGVFEVELEKLGKQLFSLQIS